MRNGNGIWIVKYKAGNFITYSRVCPTRLQHSGAVNGRLDTCHKKLQFGEVGILRVLVAQCLTTTQQQYQSSAARCIYELPPNLLYLYHKVDIKRIARTISIRRQP